MIAAPVAIGAPRGPGAEEDLPGLDPEPQLGRRRAELHRRPRRAQRLVALGLVEPEDPDDRVAEVALDRAAVLLDDRGAAVEDRVQHLGVGDVGASGEDGDEAAGVGRARDRGPVDGQCPHRREGRHDVARRGRAPRRLLREELDDQRLEARRHVGRVVGRRPGQRGEVLRQDLRRVGARERRVAGDDLVERDAEGVEVARGPDVLAADELRREVADRADDDARRGQARRAEQVRDAEVAERRAAVLGEPDVVGLDVAVDDVVRVGVREPGRDLAAEADRVRVARALAVEQLGQRAAAHRAQDEVGEAVVVARVVDGDDVRVVAEAPGDLRLADDARPCALGAGGDDDRERHLAVQPLVVGEVDLLRRPAAEAGADLVAPRYDAVDAVQRRCDRG